jgi:hypothetical protein
MRNIHRIPETIADLESQEFPNIKATAEKYDIGCKIFENRWKGKSTSMETGVSNHMYAFKLSVPHQLSGESLVPGSGATRKPVSDISIYKKVSGGRTYD